jgi:hypothetical protein
MSRTVQGAPGGCGGADVGDALEEAGHHEGVARVDRPHGFTQNRLLGSFNVFPFESVTLLISIGFTRYPPLANTL